MGGGFDKQAFDQIRRAAQASGPTTWLRNDLKKKYHNNPFEGTMKRMEGYGSEVGRRAKERLLELQAQGRLDMPNDDVLMY